MYKEKALKADFDWTVLIQTGAGNYIYTYAHLILSNTDGPLSPIQENDLTTKRIKHTDTDTHDGHNSRYLNKRPR